jgi:hypothetical protein
MSGSSRLPLRGIAAFTARATVLHLVTYMFVGAISYQLLAKPYWEGPQALPGLRNPTSEHVQRWFLVAQVLRGIIHGLVLYPLRDALLAMGRWGGAMIALLLLIIGSVAGISGLIEGLVYTTTTHVGLYLAHLPEIVIQTLAFGYGLLWWERRAMRRTQQT